MTSNRSIRAEASNARPSDCTDGGMDVDVEITADGCAFAGEVTLVWRDDRSPPEWGAWGSRDHWVSSDMLDLMRTHLRDDRVLRAALDEAEAAARRACEAERSGD